MEGNKGNYSEFPNSSTIDKSKQLNKGKKE